MNKQLLRLSGLVIGLSLILLACEKQEPAAEPRLRPVKYMQVEVNSGTNVRTFSGVSKSSQEARLSFKVSGTLTKLNVTLGDAVATGSLIAELDPSTYDLQAQQAQADLARAQAEERNAAANYQRVRDLYENKNASRTDLDSARAAAESAKAQVRAVQKALDLTRLNSSYTRLEATEDCAVASTSVEIGENVSAGQEIALVTCGDKIDIEVSVPESIIAAMRTGQAAEVTFDSIPNKVFTGEVTEVGVATTGGTTFPVTVSLADADAVLRSGLAAQVSFQFEQQATSTITLPVAAVGEDQQGRFVFLLTPAEQTGEGLIKRQGVEIGRLTNTGLEIISGIEAGDKVVTAGVTVIRDGMKVKANLNSN